MSELEETVKETFNLTKSWYEENKKKDEAFEKYRSKTAIASTILIVGLLIFVAGVIGWQFGYQQGHADAIAEITRKIILKAVGVDI